MPKPSKKCRQADTLFSKVVRRRDEHCVRCGSPTDLQAAHVVTRSEYALRFDEENAVALCRGDHVYFTHRPLDWQVWVEQQFPGLYERLWLKLQQHRAQGKRVDYDAVIAQLKLRLTELEIDDLGV